MELLASTLFKPQRQASTLDTNATTHPHPISINKKEQSIDVQRYL